MQSDEEYIPPAPAFCQRISPEEAILQAQKSTKTGLEKLYHDVVNKIDADRTKKEQQKEVANYSKILQQSKLLEAVQSFFECDEERQKAKFMNMLIDTNRNGDKVIYLENQVKSLEEVVNELKDNEEHTQEVMQGYEESEAEYKALIKKLKGELQTEKTTNQQNRAVIVKLENDLNSARQFTRIIVFCIFGAFLAVYYYM